LLVGRSPEGSPDSLQHVVTAAVTAPGDSLWRVLAPEAGRWPSEILKEFVSLALRCADARRRSRPPLGTHVLPALEAMLAEAERTVPAAHGWVNNRDTTTMAGDGDGVEEPVKVCVVCLDAEASHAFVPCGHHCVCGGCGEEMMRATRRRRRAACPVCRQRADNLIRIY